MAKIIINSGEKYNKLTIINEVEPKRYGSKKKRRVMVECDCGNVVDKDLVSVVRGQIKSCGCIGTNNRRVNLIYGQRFGKLKVLEEVQQRRKNGKPVRRIKVECDCGEILEVDLSSLTTNNTKSCGCSLLNLGHKKGVIRYEGHVFGKLTVIRELPGVRKPGGSIARVMECKCECGNIKSIRIGDLRSGKTTSCGCYVRQVNSEANSMKITIGQKRGSLVLLEETDKVTKINTKTGGALATVRYVMVKCNSCNYVEEMILRRFINETQPEHCGCLNSKTTIDRLNSKDIIEEKYNSFTVLKEVESIEYYKDKDGNIFKQRMVECKCECGTIDTYKYKDILLHYVKSCGCKEHSLSHGLCKNEDTNRMYNRWRNMLSRCYNERDNAYKNYGGRGIKVCERWRNNPQNFIDDMGIPESWDLTNDRINPDGDYEPGNCRWADKKTQQLNKRTSKWYREGKENPTIK